MMEFLHLRRLASLTRKERYENISHHRRLFRPGNNLLERLLPFVSTNIRKIIHLRYLHHIYLARRHSDPGLETRVPNL